MGFVWLLLLLLIPTSLVYCATVTIKMLRNRRATSDPQSISKNRRRWLSQLSFSAAVIAACFAALFFSGGLYSMSMTFQMSHISGATAATNHEGDTRVWISTDSPEKITFTGEKAITLNKNSGAYTNSAQSVVAEVLDKPNSILFKYNDAYIPPEYRANSVEEVGYLVQVRHFSKESSAHYTNDAHAYYHCIEVMICDDTNVLAQETFQGGLDPDTTGPDTIGPAPTAQVSKWVGEQLERLALGKASGV